MALHQQVHSNGYKNERVVNIRTQLTPCVASLNTDFWLLENNFLPALLLTSIIQFSSTKQKQPRLLRVGLQSLLRRDLCRGRKNVSFGWFSYK